MSAVTSSSFLRSFGHRRRRSCPAANLMHIGFLSLSLLLLLASRGISRGQDQSDQSAANNGSTSLSPTSGSFSSSPPTFQDSSAAGGDSLTEVAAGRNDDDPTEAPSPSGSSSTVSSPSSSPSSSSPSSSSRPTSSGATSSPSSPSSPAAPRTSPTFSSPTTSSSQLGKEDGRRNDAAAQFDGIFPCGITAEDLPLVGSYYESWQSSSLPLSDYPNFSKLVLFSFSQILSSVPVSPVLSYANDSLALKQGIEMLHAKGSKVFLSLGGAENCGNDLMEDLMFPLLSPEAERTQAQQAGGIKREKLFAKRIKEFIETFSFDGIDIDYECLRSRQDPKQNVEVASRFVKALKEELEKGVTRDGEQRREKKKERNVCLSWSAFSSIHLEGDPYHETFLAVKDDMDLFFWLAYNMNERRDYEEIASGERWDKVLSLGVHPARLLLGTCIGNGCVYHPEQGPFPEDNQKYLELVKKKGGGGVFVWAGYFDFNNATVRGKSEEEEKKEERAAKDKGRQGAVAEEKMKRSFQAQAVDYFKKNYTVYLPGVYPEGAFERILGIPPSVSSSLSLSPTYQGFLIPLLMAGAVSLSSLLR